MADRRGLSISFVVWAAEINPLSVTWQQLLLVRLLKHSMLKNFASSSFQLHKYWNAGESEEVSRHLAGRNSIGKTIQKAMDSEMGIDRAFQACAGFNRKQGNGLAFLKMKNTSSQCGRSVRRI
jgi:hypothetical protein